MAMNSRVDRHAHVIAPQQFPYSEGPGYKPRADEAGDREAFVHVLAAHGMTHALLVQPSCYGYSNACMLDAMASSGGKIKGIAVVSPEATDAEMMGLKDKGIVGIRLNLMRSDPKALSRPGAETYLARIKSLGWCVQVYATADVWAEAVPALCRCGACVLVDHFGEPDVTRGLDQPGFQAVLRLGRETDAVVKLSAPYRASRRPFPHEDVDRFVAAVVEAYGVARCIWGSDWPFINTSQQVEYKNLLHLLTRWMPSPGDRERVLWKNPARLFGFVSK